MPQALTAGKLLGLQRLANADGRFQMMAIDQRGSLQKMLEAVLNRSPEYDDLARVKTLITASLAPYASAVLTDPVYGYPHSVALLPRDVGLLLAYEESGAEQVGDPPDRVSSLIADWSVEKAVRAGADAIKLLIYYHPEARPEPRCHQQDLVRQVGELCVRYDRPFLLEVVSYPREETDNKGIDFARRKPSLVIRSAEEFSKPEYHVDVLKLEFPANLKFCREYCNGAFDGVAREPAYDLNQVQEFCNAVDEAAQVPWVILSAGVDIAEFLIAVELAAAAGASGFLCGRAIWKDALEFYPDEEAVTEWLETEGVYNFLRANAAAENALPWFEHRPFEEMESIAVAGAGPDWYRNY